MDAIPAPKRAWLVVGIVCEACGKRFDTSDGFDKHRTSDYLVCTQCHVLDDGSMPATSTSASTTIGHGIILANNLPKQDACLY